MFASSKGSSGSGGPTKGKGPAWLGSASGKGGKKATAQWKPTTQKRSDPESKQRAIRVFAAIAAVTLVASFLYYLLTRPQATPLVVLRAAAYPLQMPPLALAEEDEELLSRISPQNLRVMPVEFQSAQSGLESLKKSLATASQRFNPLQRGAKAIIVHIAAHGVVDERGQACLVPPGGDPFDSRSWLALTDILKAITEDAGLKNRDKLLLLDCQRVWSCWRAGWLENRFFDELATAVKAQNDPHLYVITSASSGQVALSAPELRGSVFGHFLARGLRGEASPRSRAVTLGGLYRYVAAEVNDYAQKRRGVAQQLSLLHRDQVIRPEAIGQLPAATGSANRGMEIPLCYIDRAHSQRKLSDLQSTFDLVADFKKTVGTSSLPASTGSAAASTTLSKVWQLYRQRQQPAPPANNESPALPGYVVDPVAWSSIEQRLAAVGERLLAGKQYQTPALQAEIDRLAKDLSDDRQWQLQGTLPGLSLRQLNNPQTAESGQRLPANVFLAYEKAEPDKKNEALPKGLARARAVRDVYAALTDTSATADARARLALAADFLQKAAPVEPSVDLLAGHFLNLLNRGLPQDAPLSAERLAAALQSRQAAEQAATPPDWRVQYAVESLTSAADERRRQAEDDLFTLTDSSDQQGLALYDETLARGQRLLDFFRLCDQVWAELPLIAEWQLTRAALAAEAAPVARLTTALKLSIDLDDAIERVLRTREEPSTFAAPLQRCDRVFAELSPLWLGLRQELAAVYERPTTVERSYRRPDDLRNAELALRWPPLTSDLAQFVERYLETLGDSAAGSQAAAAPLATAPPSQNGEFFRELHRALDYEFVDPYEQHRHSTLWDEKKPADAIFRTTDRANPAAWTHLQNLLDEYNKAIEPEPLVWSRTQPAYAASTRLRQWDRRVRVASNWLSSFQPTLRRPGQATPARWLQEYDAAHLTAWHAYRALGDFWGNGEAHATGGTPFFAAAIGRCDAVLPERLRPIRYDVPGGTLADFAAQGAASLQALRAWDPIEFPRSFNVSAGAGNETRLDVAIQPASAPDLKLPPGTAALELIPAADTTVNPPRITFDPAGQKRAEPVKLPVAGPRPVTATAIVERSSSAGSGNDAFRLEARLWYRGHVKLKPCPIGEPATNFVEYQFDRPRYAAPTVEVRGTDTIRGAVLFVFDCSRSMQGGGFALAQSQLAKVLDQLWRDAGDSLEVGLMTYGSRTDASAGYYTADSRRTSPALSPAGQQAQSRDPNFTAKNPQPDGDVTTLVPLAGNNAQSVLAALRTLTNDNCVGVTPLYYATAQAIETALRDAADQPARRIVVISDGVNMPYNTGRDPRTGNYFLGRIGTQVNQEDYDLLDKALTRAQGTVSVTVQLFGARNTDFEAEQYRILKRLDENHPNFEVFEVDPTFIADSIRRSFPKTQIELRADRGTTPPQPLAFNQPAPVTDWDSAGFLRREYLRRLVRLTLPGEERSLEKTLDLLGGERVVLSYDAGAGRLTFDDDGLTRRGTGPVEAPRASDSRKLAFDALDPERVGASVRKLRFRIRDEDRAARFAPRPEHIWLEMRPRGAGSDADGKVFPCLDPAWIDNVNLPRLAAPVERWPQAPSARVQAWFRYDDPAALQKITVPRDSAGQTVTIEKEPWRIENVVGDSDSVRKVVVIWQPSDSQPSLEKLLNRAVWLSPPPDHVRRRYATDGREAIHEFTYTQPDLVKRDAEITVVTKAQFQQGAYSTEFDFDVAN